MTIRYRLLGLPERFKAPSRLTTSEVSGKSFITARFLQASLLMACLVNLTACSSRLPVHGAANGGFEFTLVAELDDNRLFAADGVKQVAISSQGVRVVTLPALKSRTLSAEHPSALAWSQGGKKLAAAFEHGTETRITVFGVNGAEIAGTTTPGRIAALFWRTADILLAVSIELEQHSFGTSCREVLLHWQPGGIPQRTLLHEVTLKPYTIHKWGAERLARVIAPAISPLGDELVYGKIQDPPAAEAYLKVSILNISGGTEREIAKTGLRDGSARFSADGEELLMHDASGHLRWLDSWSGAEIRTTPLAGRSLSMSPDGRYLLADGRLLESGREIVQFPSRTTGEFMDAGQLLVNNDGTLFLVTGLEPSAPQPVTPQETLERLRTIKAWRASGYISAGDYLAAKERLLTR